MVALAACVLALAVAAGAAAHVERASYWPNPNPESVVGPQGGSGHDNAKLKKQIKRAKARHQHKLVKKLKRRLHKRQVQAENSAQLAGGGVPVIRPLATALNQAASGNTHVVCPGGAASVPRGPSKKALAKLRKKIKTAKAAGKTKLVKKLKRKLARRRLAPLSNHPSIKALKASIKAAEAHGYKLRPSQRPTVLSPAEGKDLLNTNLKLLQACSFGSIQDAVNASHNNDRVVIMPGLYTEPKSRAAPTNDPRCSGLKEINDRGQTGANSYRYVAACPNDQNLIAVIGREPGPNPPPQPPLDNRHGIPDLGPCVRCNLQMEGSGVSADDVVVDAGRVESGNGGPAEPVKDVGIRADRADGFVLRNLTVRHVREHGIYVHEVDGYVLDRFKAFHAEEYGVLTFTSDHGLMQRCDASGSGDAAIYPGSAPDTGEQTIEAHQRLNTEIRDCDMHHSSAGYSGTASNAVWFHDNEIYDNALGFTTDVFTAAGHPGYPQDSDLIEHNNFHSNNFNPYLPYCDTKDFVSQACSDINPTIPVPVGTGLWIAGGNNNELRNNHFWDNWRRGTMLFAVPDAFVCGNNPVAGGNQQHGCSEGSISTSFRNRFHDNVMSRTPDGKEDPNGVDFWWDQFPGNTNNCWYGNVGKDGTRASLTSSPAKFPTPGLSVPLFLPEDCATSIGTAGALQETELLACFATFDQGVPLPCDWFTTPPEPAP